MEDKREEMMELERREGVEEKEMDEVGKGGGEGDG